MCAVKRARNPHLPVNIGTVMTRGYIAVPAAAPRYSVRVPSSILARVGLLFGNPSIRPMSPRKTTAAFSQGELKYCARIAMHIWGMCSTMVPLQPVYAIASIRPHSSSITKLTRYKEPASKSGYLFRVRGSMELPANPAREFFQDSCGFVAFSFVPMPGTQ